jgi:hypothetical protein
LDEKLTFPPDVQKCIGVKSWDHFFGFTFNIDISWGSAGNSGSMPPCKLLLEEWQSWNYSEGYKSRSTCTTQRWKDLKWTGCSGGVVFLFDAPGARPVRRLRQEVKKKKKNFHLGVCQHWRLKSSCGPLQCASDQIDKYFYFSIDMIYPGGKMQMPKPPVLSNSKCNPGQEW